MPTGAPLFYRAKVYCRQIPGCLIALMFLPASAATLAAPMTDNYCPAQDALGKSQLPQSIDDLESLKLNACAGGRQAALSVVEQALAAENPAIGQRGRYAFWLARAYLDGGPEEQAKANEWLTKTRQWAGDDALLMFNARLDQIRMLAPAQRLAAFPGLFSAIAALPDSPGQSRLFWELGAQAQMLGQPGFVLAFSAYERARNGANRQGDGRLLSMSLASLGSLYELQNRIEEALALTEQAMLAAQGWQDHALWWPLDAQLGRLLRKQGDNAGALAAFRRAVRHIEAIRLDIPVRFDAAGNSSFRENLAPIYLAMADLLLRQASENPRNNQEPLREARNIIELSKQAELEDYLGERCSVEEKRHAAAERAPAGTAILYPLVLPDRLELLLEINGRLDNYTVAVSADKLKAATLNLVSLMRSPRRPSFEAESRQLNSWLIEPLEPSLKSESIKTLLTVPDDFLRLLPLSALYDGKQFLIERYAVAVSPALSILSGHAIPKPSGKMLLAGLGHPPGDYTPLPGVEREIKELHRYPDSVVLLDQEFTVSGFKKQLTEDEYSIVHIASHGEFEDEAKNTFLMAYDGEIRLDKLQELLNARRELDILSFSACQTALGNDRSPLGFSGMAIKANARSVIGTLWQVNDIAAEKIMTAFYRDRLQAGLGKAEALRQAQLEWLQDGSRRHPFYWSAFILVGDWL